MRMSSFCGKKITSCGFGPYGEKQQEAQLGEDVWGVEGPPGCTLKRGTRGPVSSMAARLGGQAWTDARLRIWDPNGSGRKDLSGVLAALPMSCVLKNTGNYSCLIK